MSVIQKIRDKYIGVVIVAIVVALVGFLIMDALQSNFSNVFKTDRNLLGKVNGTRIENDEYQKLLTRMEDNVKNNKEDKTLTEEDRAQIQEQSWDLLVNEKMIEEEQKKLGIEFTNKELQDAETGTNPDPQIRQSFTDPATGIFDPNKVKQYITQQLNQKGNEEAKKQWIEFEEGMIKQHKQQKYVDLFKAAIFTPQAVKKFEKTLTLNQAAIDFVSAPYNTINDKDITIKDDEIKTYMNSHVTQYSSEKPTAKVEYVSFDITPSTEDTANSLGVLMGLKETFSAATDNEEFIAKNSDDAYDTKYYTQKKIKLDNAAELINAPTGSLVGPFYDKGAYKIVKIVDKKGIPDSVRASHILITVGEKHTDENAKAIIDSLETQVKAGASLAALAQARSEDGGSGAKGGDLGYFAQGMMVPEFNDFCFNGKEGELKVVKTKFGYHLIKITGMKTFNPGVKMATLSKQLIAGQATINKVYAQANEFNTNTTNAKLFEEKVKKFKKDKRVADNLTKSQQVVPGLGMARELTRWAFEAKVGDVSPIINLADKSIIATLVSKTEKGLMSVDAVRSQIENILRKQKKAVMIADKVKGKTSLQDIATTLAIPIQVSDTVLYNGTNTQIGYEPRVIGAAFDKNYIGKTSPAIAGEQAVYFINVKNVRPNPSSGSDPSEFFQQLQMDMQTKQSVESYLPAMLKKASTIQDNRYNF